MTDPREGEWPDPAEYCPHGIEKNHADCGQCIQEAGIRMFNGRDEQGRELSEDEAAAALQSAFDRLRRHYEAKKQQQDDETMGAHLAARFERSA